MTAGIKLIKECVIKGIKDLLIIVWIGTGFSIFVIPDLGALILKKFKILKVFIFVLIMIIFHSTKFKQPRMLKSAPLNLRLVEKIQKISCVIPRIISVH